MLDEWGYFESGHMGSTDLITPNIDQFASEGMRLPMLMQGLQSADPPVALTHGTACRKYVRARK